MEKKKLYRSTKNKMLGGVCGGFGEYFNIDPTIIRILFILLVFLGGGGILFYLISLIIIPLDPDYSDKKKADHGVTFSSFFGIGLILLGIIILLSNFGLHPFHFLHFSWSLVFSLFLILLGIFLIFKPDQLFKGIRTDSKTLTKSKTDKMIFGVCGGMGEYLQIDSTFVRLFWVFFTLSSFGFSVIIYLTLALVLPSERFIEKEI